MSGGNWNPWDALRDCLKHGKGKGFTLVPCDALGAALTEFGALANVAKRNGHDQAEAARLIIGEIRQMLANGCDWEYVEGRLGALCEQYDIGVYTPPEDA